MNKLAKGLLREWCGAASVEGWGGSGKGSDPEGSGHSPSAAAQGVLEHHSWTQGLDCGLALHRTRSWTLTLVGPFQLGMLCGSMNSAEHGCKARRSLSWHVVWAAVRESYEKLKREPWKELSQHIQKCWKQGCKQKLRTAVIQTLGERDLELWIQNMHSAWSARCSEKQNFKASRKCNRWQWRYLFHLEIINV